MAQSMLAHAFDNAQTVEFYVANCGFVHVTPSLKIQLISMMSGVITTEQLGKAMVILAMEGKETRILWNQDLVELGNQAAGQWAA